MPEPVAFASSRCIHEWFEAHATHLPHSDALVCGDDRLTYEQLNRRVNQLAWRLKSAGVGPEKLVAVCLPRTIQLPIAILAVLKAGGAYVPLDPNYPPMRLKQILETSAPSVLLTQTALADRFALQPSCIQMLVDDARTARKERDDNPPHVSELHHLAYVIFTSGSTGTPKGVAIEHRGPAALMQWARDTFSDEETAGVTCSASVCFDFSVFEMFVPLTRGSKLILLPNVLELPNAPAANGATMVSSVPTAMAELIRMGGVPSSVRAIMLGGEALPAALARSCYDLPHVQAVYNLYGPTEDTVISTMFRVPRNVATPSIGHTIAGTRAFILDARMRPVDSETTGELFLSGCKLARGYLNRDDLTRERFILSPFEAGERLYRTGDLCRWNEDGTIHYQGRIDHQVKLRGFRIELGEIESVLGAHDGVNQCRVVAKGEASQQKLVAYVVPQSDPAPTVSSMRDYLSAHLPAHMVPAAFVFLKAMPLTPAGKIDLAALPPPTTDNLATEPIAPSSISAAPATPQADITTSAANIAYLSRHLERELLAIWREVLGVASVRPTDSFFDLGGNSLLAVRLMQQVQEQLGKAFQVSALFHAPTVNRFLAMLAETPDAVARTAQQAALVPIRLIPIRGAEGARPLFCIPGAGGHPFTFRALLPYLPKDLPLYGTQFQALESVPGGLESIEAMAAAYLAQILQVQPTGPYRICGYSLGSVIAFEIAQRLEAQGEQVELLVFFDGYAPGAVVPKPAWRRLLIHTRRMIGRSPISTARYLADKAKHRLMKHSKSAESPAPHEPALVDHPNSVLSAIRRVRVMAVAAGERYRPARYSGAIHVIKAAQRPDWVEFNVDQPANGWDHFAARVMVNETPGTHETMFDEPNVAALCATFNGLLA